MAAEDAHHFKQLCCDFGHPLWLTCKQLNDRLELQKLEPSDREAVLRQSLGPMYDELFPPPRPSVPKPWYGWEGEWDD